MDYKIEYIGFRDSIYKGKYVVTIYGGEEVSDKFYLAIASFLLFCDKGIDTDDVAIHHIIDYVAEGVTVVNFLI